MAYYYSEQIIDMIRAHKDPADILHVVHETYDPMDDIHWNLTLVCSIQFQHDLLVTHLLNVEKVDVNCIGDDGYPSPRPLAAAVCVGRMDYVTELLQRGANVTRRAAPIVGTAGTEIMSAVEFALRDNRLDFLKLFEPHYDPALYSCSLLCLACQLGSYECTRYLLTSPVHCADVNSMDKPNNNFTPLMYAVRYSAKLTQLLLDHGASPLSITPVIQYRDGAYTVLHAATMPEVTTHTNVFLFLPKDLPVIICILLGSGCDVNAKTSEGETALSQMCSQVLLETDVYKWNAKSPYDIQRHQAIITDSVTVLLRNGAISNATATKACDVIMRYTQDFALFSLESGDLVPSYGAVALASCRNILSLVSEYASCVFSSQVVGFISTTLVRASSICSKSVELQMTDDCLSTIIHIVCDIVRLLLLASIDSDYDAVTVQLCQCHYTNMELFAGVLELVLNVVDEGRAWRCTDSILCCISNEVDDCRKQQLLTCVNSILRRPRSLRQQCRYTILHSLCAGERIHIISSLRVLPQMMIDYVLSLKN